MTPPRRVSELFQLLNCLTLGFKPKLGLRLRGGTKRNAYPELRATFASRGAKDSNLKNMAVVIPHQMFLAQNHIRGICTRAQFDADNCPANSVYGRAVAYTPLFDDPLSGNVYLRSAPGRKLPDLVASLYSGAVHIVVEGKIGPSGSGGILTQLHQPPRRADRPLHDDPLRRQARPAWSTPRTSARRRRGLGQSARPKQHRRDLHDTALRGQCGKARHKKKAHHKTHKRHHRRATSATARGGR